MELTRAEFCSFNTHSRLQLIQKDGSFMAERQIYPTHLVKLYLIYTFYVEVITELNNNEVVIADPIISSGMLSLYNNES